MSQERSRLFHWAKTRLSLGLGLLMLTFGVLKLVNPTIDGWFHVQMQQSHLPHPAILMGKIAEIVTGLLFLLPRFRPWPAKWEDRSLLIACSSLFLVMLVAVYVHLQPGVPPEVLPLGIKPPVIPLFVVLLDVMVAIPASKDAVWTRHDRGHAVQSAQPTRIATMLMDEAERGELRATTVRAADFQGPGAWLGRHTRDRR